MNASYDLPEQLLWRVPPIRGHQVESLGSWMFRLGQANGLPDLQSTLMELGFEERVYISRLDYPENSAKVVERIAHASSQSPEVVHSLLLNEPLARLSGGKVSARNPWTLRSGLRQGKEYGMAFHVCPRCIRDSAEPWWPRGWRMAVMTVCPIHRVLLEPHCTRCAHPFLIHGRRTAPLDRCEWCNLELANMLEPTYLSSGPAAEFVRYLLWDTESAGRLPDQQAAWQSIRKLLKLVSSSAWPDKLMRCKPPYEFDNLLYDVARSGRRRFDAWPVYQRHQALRFVEWLMDGWPYLFVDMLRRSGLSGRAIDFLRGGKEDWVSRAMNEHFPVSRSRWPSMHVTRTHLSHAAGDDVFARFAVSPPLKVLPPSVAWPFIPRRRSKHHG